MCCYCRLRQNGPCHQRPTNVLLLQVTPKSPPVTKDCLLYCYERGHRNIAPTDSSVVIAGYGNIAPVTEAGRVATMLYAVIGVPLALIVLAELGRRFTAALKFLWGFIRRYYYTGYCLKVRRRAVMGSSYDMAESQAGLDNGDGLGNGDLRREGSYRSIVHRNAGADGTCCREGAEAGGWGGRGNGGGVRESGRLGYGEMLAVKEGASPCRPGNSGPAAGNNGPVVRNYGTVVRNHGTVAASVSTKKKQRDELDGAGRSQTEDSRTATNTSNNNAHAGNTVGAPDFVVSVYGGDSTPRRGASVGAGNRDLLRKSSVFLDEAELNEDFKLPVSVAVGFIFAYIFVGAGMYRLWENWTYLESFYFVFITTSTIGFGDVLPEHPNFFLLSCVYTFLGPVSYTHLTLPTTAEV